MQNLTLRKHAINPDKLHAELQAALGDACTGLSFAAGSLTVHLGAEATVEQRAQAEAIAAAHDPDALTAAQQTARDRDALPFFALTPAELEARAKTLDEQALRLELVRAFAHLRDLVRRTATTDKADRGG